MCGKIKSSSYGGKLFGVCPAYLFYVSRKCLMAARGKRPIHSVTPENGNATTSSDIWPVLPRMLEPFFSRGCDGFKCVPIDLAGGWTGVPAQRSASLAKILALFHP